MCDNFILHQKSSMIMKQFFFLAVGILLSGMVRAQVASLDIQNNRPCDVYLILHGDNGCGTGFRTAVITVPANAIWPALTTSSFSWAGTPPSRFTSARVYQWNPGSCSVSAVDVGEPCLPLPSMASQVFYDNLCMPCPTGTAPSPVTWNHLSPAQAILTIHP